MSRKLLTSIIIFISLTTSSFAMDTDVIKLKRAGSITGEISNPYGSLWEYAQNGTTWSITNSSNGKVVFKKEYETLAEGNFSGNKLTMETPRNELYLYVKVTSDKVKVNWNDRDDEWVLKLKEDKIKAKYNEMNYGKIKFDSKTKKLKVKDRFEKAIVQIKPYDKLAFAPGAFLMGDLSENQQIFLTLLLFSKNK